MNPFLLIVVGGVVGLIFDSLTNKEKADGNVHQNGGDGAAGDCGGEPRPGNQQSNGDGVTAPVSEPEPELKTDPSKPPTESPTDEVSSDRPPIPDVRVDRAGDDLSGE